MAFDHRIRSEDGELFLEKIRRICSELPETEETIDGFGCTVFKIRGKSFIRLSESEIGGLRITFKSDHEHQELLLQDPLYEKAPYIGHHGWVSIKENALINWTQFGTLLKMAYMNAAPKRLRNEYMKQQ